ncbi:MAG: hypothetical protein AB7F88_16390 [Pyrinomonadaceae bacterium]
MLIKKGSLHLYISIVLFAVAALSGCGGIVKTDKKTATLLKTEDASQAQLMAEVNRFARVESIRAKMDLKFEDNSFAEFGSKEVYRSADGEIVVQRPGRIMLNVKVPVVKADVARMTSDGQHFRVAILQDGGSGRFKKFVKGTNSADYSQLQTDLAQGNGDGDAKKNVNAFANLRPQHFTEAMLVRPTDDQHLYVSSTTFQIEEDPTAGKKSPLRKVNRGYYLLDEYERRADGELKITRRFWFDRVGGIRLARQQLFDAKGELEADITYGAEGNLTDTGQYNRLPLQVLVTRPQEKYAMRLTYQIPEDVKIGDKYPDTAFVLQNSWGLEELDLDKKLQEVTARKSSLQTPPAVNSNSASRFQ